MKIGIITLFGENYGNKLQNLAVQKLFESKGCEAETIIVKVKNGIIKPTSLKHKLKKLNPLYIIKVLKQRFKNKYHYKNSRDGIIKSVRFVKKTNIDRLYKSREASFEQFTKQNLKLADFELTLDNINDSRINEYDYFVAGSDQVWNPTYPHTSCINFLTFAPKHKRIALAPSFGLSSLPEYVKPIYKKWIGEIPSLSVRENKGAEIIKELTGRNAVVLADPTLCVSRQDWEKVEKKPTFDTAKPFVFTYFLGNETNSYRSFVEKYAKNNGYEIINIFDLREPEFYSVNPAEFVYLIHNAKMVFTDSFHGTVFSLIMHTPFVVFDRIENGGISMSSRIETLLNKFSMNKRHFNELDKKQIDNIDFSNVDQTIKNLQTETDGFLDKALQTKSFEEENKTFVEFLNNKIDCCGCHACYNVCTQNCITMNADSEGFWYPNIDFNKCVHCNMCQKVCPAVTENKIENKPVAYLGYNKNSIVRINSSSGGMFTPIAEYIIDRGGTVFGAAFNDRFEVEHSKVETLEELSKLRGSKYVQSKIGDTYKQVKSLLKDGKLVLFTGTPCQIEGLYSYLGKINTENLFTQDIICHGVPSPKVWQEYLQYRANGAEIKNVSFRDKKYGWHYFSMRIDTDKKKYTKRLDEDLFIRLFLDNTILRPSCYDCKFKKEVRISDFTLADCWRPNSVKSQLKDDDKGLSMMFVNTEKGKALFDKISDSYVIQNINYDLAIKSQSAATQSVTMNPNRKRFFSSVERSGFAFVPSNWYRFNPLGELKKKVIYYKGKWKLGRYYIGRLLVTTERDK